MLTSSSGSHGFVPVQTQQYQVQHKEPMSSSFTLIAQLRSR